MSERDFTVLSQNQGVVTTDFGDSDTGRTLRIQADGKILLGGTSDNGFALARYNTDGTLDTSFNSDGKLTTDLGGNDYGSSLSLQTDGKILLAGSTYSNSNYNFTLVRYNADGSLDTSFSNDGKLTTDLGSNYDYGNSLTLQTDGKILLGGTSGGNFALVRYNTDGSLDTSFSDDGKLTTDLGSNYDYGNSLTLQTDGKVLLGGTSGGNFALVRYNTDGSLDTSFSDDGKLTTDLGSNYDYGNNLSLQTDGKILLGGAAYGKGFALVRYNSDGSLDTSFSDDGKLTTDLGGYTIGNSLSIQTDGKILLSGYAEQNSDANFALVRYNTDGSLDTRFDNDGTLISDLGGNDYGQSLGLQTDGRILLGGYTYDGEQYSFALVRYNTDGSVDTRFGTSTGSITISGTAAQNQILTASHTLTNVGAITYQWLADGVAISGAITNTLTLNQAQVGKTISIKASYTNTQNTLESITSNVTTAVQNINDAPTGQLTISGLIQGNALIGHKLTAINTLTDADGLGSFSYQWFANDTIVNGATNNTFTPTIWQLGKQITVKVQYTDALGTHELVQSEAVNSATDSQYGDSIREGSNDRLKGGVFASDLYGFLGNDELHGAAGDDRLYGSYGNDLLYGEADNDELQGNQNNDTLIGGNGRDLLNGGAGRDVFKLEKLIESGITAANRDVIQDFTRGQDQIALSSIDANSKIAGNQAFTNFISSTTTFNKAGQLQFKNGVLYGNTDNDSTAEFSIALTGVSSLSMSDIIG